MFKLTLLALVASAGAFAPVARRPVATALDSKVDSILEEIKTLTLVEASELVKAIETEFDVDASAGGGGMMMMAPGAGAGPAEAAPEKDEFDVVIASVPADKKIAVLKVVRTITGLGLKEAKAMVEATPVNLKEGLSKDEAESIKKDIEAAGGVVELK